ncbi:alcohol dehydrogenase catalytic domain-containing protein [Amycolatopsis sp. NPDC051903]|uniref:alcohol dehydrogenase catalytic domain-containing protein n=1 Tax=Amycolatopsis sp. NPDC051903 TaxID=3363936 RepID=UPI0037A21CA4
MTVMQEVVVPSADADWELRDTEVPEPGPGQVLIRVHACGICGTDVWLTEAKLSFGPFPLFPGHEGVGEVVAVGAGVTSRAVGDRVGICTLQRGCGHCAWCTRAEPLDFVTAANCPNAVVTGMTARGAHADYLAVPDSATVLLPDGLSYELAAPVLCVGYTAWAGLRRADPRPGDRIAVSGIGGLGHLAVQYAKAAGFKTVAITRSEDKRRLALDLGANVVVGSGEELRAAGGADVLLATNNSNAAVVDAMQGVNPRGRVVLMGIAFDEFTVTTMPVVMNSLKILGSAHNGTQYLVEALELAAAGKVIPMVEVYGKDRIADAYRRAAEGKARFRAVVSYA